MADALGPPALAPIDHALAPGGLVIFGELHGTLEAPAFVAAAAEHAAARGPVLVALEVPDDVQAGVDACLAAPDDAAGRAALVTTLDERASRAGQITAPPMFWQWRDGRGGEGLARLLERVRTLRTAHPVRVLCFDGVFETAEQRDAGMAANILAAMQPSQATLVLCGNLHACTDEPPWMGWHLRAAHPALVSLDLGHDGGHAFCATDEGEGIKACLPRWPGPPGVELWPERMHGWDGTYRVGRITPSLPLVPA